MTGGSAEGAQLSSSATLDTAVNFAAARWDAFTGLMVESLDLVRMLEAFVTNFRTLDIPALEAGQPEEQGTVVSRSGAEDPKLLRGVW